eukprot:g2312.t1
MTRPDLKKTNPTVQDVARVAKVSTATVSRALSMPNRVSEETRNKVARAVEQTGYVLNHAARNLRRRDTGVIVALIPDIGNSHFSNILQGIETVCADHNLKVLIADTRKPSMARSNLSDFFSQNNCDGIVIMDGHFSIAEIKAANPKLPPIVTVGEWSDDPAVPMAVVNNLLGAELAVRHLLEIGHGKIGHITGLLSHKSGRDRQDGFRATLADAGLDGDAAWVFEGDYTLDAGMRAAEAWLLLEDRPTAVFCGSDRTAFGFISALCEKGVQVPSDVSVVGYDDIDIAGHFVPPLTSVHQPRRAVGEQAAQLLLGLLQGGQPTTTNVQLEPWLAVRKSTAKPGRRIAFVLFDRTKLIDVTGPLQVFNDARFPDENGQPGCKAYEIELLSELGGPVDTDAGISLETDTFENCMSDPPDTLLVSGGNSALEAANLAGLQSFLAFVSDRVRRVGSICLGAFVLAKGGHLSGKRATTHWMACSDLQRLYPDIQVNENSIFEKDGKVWTSAGVTSGIDMALAMVEEDLGRAEALRLAQSLVLYVRRTGGQQQFSSALARQVQSTGDDFDDLITEIMTDLAADLSVPRLAEMAHMSERNFARKFSKVMGMSPARFVEDLRVEAVCETMQRGEATLAELPHLFGFGNAERMRRAFQRKKGIAPQDYLQRFGSQTDHETL